jgi:hypothetical protein
MTLLVPRLRICDSHGKEGCDENREEQREESREESCKDFGRSIFPASLVAGLLEMTYQMLLLKP